jgi:hypothetical protein
VSITPQAIVHAAVIAPARFQADLQLENALLQRRLREFLETIVGGKQVAGAVSRVLAPGVTFRPGSPPHPMRPWGVARLRARAERPSPFSG